MRPQATPDPVPTAAAAAAAAALEARDRELAGWLDAAARGDCTAFEAFYDATIGYAQAVARRLLAAADVEDLLADAYFEAWRKVARFDPARGSAVTWLLTIVRSRCLDLLRSHRVHPSVGRSDAEPPEAADDAADPIEHHWQRQAQGALAEALRELGAAERWVLGLAYFRELSHAQIALATGMPLGTVKTLLQRAQARLRTLLAPLAGAPGP